MQSLPNEQNIYLATFSFNLFYFVLLIDVLSFIWLYMSDVDIHFEPVGFTPTAKDVECRSFVDLFKLAKFGTSCGLPCKACVKVVEVH